MQKAVHRATNQLKEDFELSAVPQKAAAHRISINSGAKE